MSCTLAWLSVSWGAVGSVCVLGVHSRLRGTPALILLFNRPGSSVLVGSGENVGWGTHHCCSVSCGATVGYGDMFWRHFLLRDTPARTVFILGLVSSIVVGSGENVGWDTHKCLSVSFWISVGYEDMFGQLLLFRDTPARIVFNFWFVSSIVVGSGKIVFGDTHKCLCVHVGVGRGGVSVQQLCAHLRITRAHA